MASSLRAARLLSMSSSLSRSTMDVRQLSFCGLAAAFFSIRATTSTMVMEATGAGDGAAAGAGAADGAGAAAGG
ncbi:hypothetical protein D9M68_968020 [compost metagenome]